MLAMGALSAGTFPLQSQPLPLIPDDHDRRKDLSVFFGNHPGNLGVTNIKNFGLDVFHLPPTNQLLSRKERT